MLGYWVLTLCLPTVAVSTAGLHSDTASSGGHCQWLLGNGGWLAGQGHCAIHGCTNRTGMLLWGNENFDGMMFCQVWLCVARLGLLSQWEWAVEVRYSDEFLTSGLWVFDCVHPPLPPAATAMDMQIQLSESLGRWLCERWIQLYITPQNLCWWLELENVQNIT